MTLEVKIWIAGCLASLIIFGHAIYSSHKIRARHREEMREFRKKLDELFGEIDATKDKQE